MDVADRLRALRNSKRISQEELASGSGLSVDQVRNIEATSSATLKELVEVSKFFKADLNWFILGIGEESITNDYMMLIDTDAAAGYLENKDDPAYYSQLEYFRIPGFSKDGEYRIFKVHGDSMYPTLSENDHLVCSRVKDHQELETGDMAVFITKSDIVVKRVRFTDNKIMLESDNDAFEAFQISDKAVVEVWKVEGKVTKIVERLSNSKDINAVASEVKEMREQISFFKTELERINKLLAGTNNK
jgi:phage repressor protein C with HTH and peptisase S24 domain